MRYVVALVTLVGVGMGPATAIAEEDCPPGGWFCEEAEPPAESGAATTEGGETEVVVLPEGEPGSAPSVVVVTPEGSPPPRVIVVGEATEPPPPPEPIPAARGREWGFSLRLQTALLGDDPGRSEESGMGGLGFGFRYRPVPHFAVGSSIDFLGGRDWQGNRRSETALSFDGTVFFNPKDPVQFFVLGGFGWSRADVELVSAPETTMATDDGDRQFSYFGGHLGAGLEIRVSKRTALDFDLVGFMRGRTDHLAESEPEFVDPNDSRITTNTSGGGLARAGVTFYW